LELRKNLYQAKLRLLHPNKAEAIKVADQELDKAMEKIEKLKPKNERK